jgi:NAD(P)H-hydrate epimerase
VKLVTAAQMRELEQDAVAAGTSLDELMEQAGLAAAQEAWLSLGVVAGRRILVLCGPGNNGGDGLVAARHLAEWEGDVVVYLLAPRAAADSNLAKVRELGVPIFAATEDVDGAALQQALDGAEMVIDALLGTGRSRAIDGALAEILRRLHDAGQRGHAPRILAVDLPTGIDADSGRADALAVRADMTVTFGLAKVGLYTLPGSEYAGRVQVVDIGLPKESVERVPLDLLDTSWVRPRLPERPKSGNKGTFGKVLVVAGSRSYVGAARLAAEACYRAGAGLVTIACPASLQAMLAPAIAEATWLPLDEEHGALTAAAGAAVLEALASYDVLLIGPGLGQSTGVRHAVTAIVASLPSHLRGCVIDADALNALAGQPAWHERVAVASVLTPHPGEMARLRGTTVAAVQDDRLNTATSAAAAWRQTVVLKGAHTVVAASDGRGAISPSANPLLATAGTGDVLAGAIAGLMAQGLAAFEAAGCGVYLHGLAADELGEDLGDRGLLAGDLLKALPSAMRTVLHGRAMRASPGLPGLPDLGGFRGGGLGALAEFGALGTEPT